MTQRPHPRLRRTGRRGRDDGRANEVALKDPKIQAHRHAGQAPRRPGKGRRLGPVRHRRRLPGMKIATVAACPVLGGTLASVDDSAREERARRTPGGAPGQRGGGDRRPHVGGQARASPPRHPLERGPNAKLSTADIVQRLSAASEESGAVARKEGDATRPWRARHKLEAVYELPFLAHATLEPINCTVHVRPDACDIWVGPRCRPSRRRAAAS